VVLKQATTETSVEVLQISLVVGEARIPVRVEGILYLLKEVGNNVQEDTIRDLLHFLAVEVTRKTWVETQEIVIQDIESPKDHFVVLLLFATIEIEEVLEGTVRAIQDMLMRPAGGITVQASDIAATGEIQVQNTRGVTEEVAHLLEGEITVHLKELVHLQ
jgi:hypothetical protein